MALPKLETPKHSCTLPGNGQTVTYRPFLVGEQKLLLIAQESENQNDMLREMMRLIEICTDDVKVRELTSIDIEWLFLNIRMKSIGETSNVVGRVKNWDADTGVLQVGIMTGTFYEGERLVGAKSGATYETSTTGTASTTADKYSQNEDIEFDADQIIDFSESNPFGTF